MLQLGDFKIHLINDSHIMVDPGGAFGLVPRVLWSRYLQPDENQLVPMHQHCLLVQVDGKNILVDSGYGRKLDEKARKMWHLTHPNGDLIEALARAGVQPEDVSLVINTHLHADHCAGNTLFVDDGKIVPAFPNAVHVVQRREYEDAMHPNERTAATYYPINYQPLMESGQLQLLDGDTEIAPGIQGIVTRGHTPAHMSIRFESQGQHLAFVCDLASYAVHFERLAWMTAYDVEPLHTLETKREWQKWALETNALLIFPHDSVRPAGRLTLDEKGKPALQTVEIPFL
jgi:glyoxylase-like metal-dependent hydrolase (beta-lactamase superfamily II)